MAWITTKTRKGREVTRLDPVSGDELAYWVLGWRDLDTGRTKSRGLGFITVEQAELELKLFGGQLAEDALLGRGLHGSSGHAHTGSVPTIERYLDEVYLPARRKLVRPSSFESDFHTAKAVRKTMGTRRLDKIGGPDIQRHIRTRLDAGRSKNTVNGDLTLLRSLFKHACVGGVVKAAPFIERLRIDEPARPFLTEKQTIDLLTALKVHRGGPHWYVYVCTLMAVNTGMRRGELLSREWEDVQWDDGPHGAVTVGPKPQFGFITKTYHSTRVIPMTPELRAELEEWHLAGGQPTEGLLFPSPRSGGLPRRDFRHLLRAGCERAGIRPKISPHALRRTWASRLAKTCDRATILRLGGWINGAQLDRAYAHVTTAHIAETIALHGITA